MAHNEIGVKEAVELAIRYYQSLSSLLPTNDLRLEETVINEEGQWLVTLSSKNPMESHRLYKIFQIDSKTKEILSMRIRNPEISAY